MANYDNPIQHTVHLFSSLLSMAWWVFWLKSRAGYHLNNYNTNIDASTLKAILIPKETFIWYLLFFYFILIMWMGTFSCVKCHQTTQACSKTILSNVLVASWQAELPTPSNIPRLEGYSCSDWLRYKPYNLVLGYLCWYLFKVLSADIQF